VKDGQLECTKTRIGRREKETGNREQLVACHLGFYMALDIRHDISST
jgi:hypothetical protein